MLAAALFDVAHDLATVGFTFLLPHRSDTVGFQAKPLFVIEAARRIRPSLTRESTRMCVACRSIVSGLTA